MSKLHAKYMELAIKEARKNLKSMHGGPFGACIVKGNRVIAVARNRVLQTDATAHAEVNAIRKASELLKTYNLSGCTIYSTTEPCPMCFSAIHWARIDKVIYGTSIVHARELGFNELNISAKKMKKAGCSKVKIHPNFLLKDCLCLFRDWQKAENKRLY